MSNTKILDACVYKNKAYDKVRTTHCLGGIPSTGN